MMGVDMDNIEEVIEAKLNPQGMSRGNESLMSCIVVDEGQTFVSVDLCLPPETEVLTRYVGFKRLDKLVGTESVWQVDKNTLVGSWVRPSRIVDRRYTGDMLTYSTVRGSLEVTREHTMLWVGQVNHPTREDKRLYRKVTKAGDGLNNSGCHIAMYSEGDSVSDYSYDEIDTACMFSADGYMLRKDIYNIEVSRPVKRARVTELLGRSGKLNETRKLQKLKPERWNYCKFTSPLLIDKYLTLHSLGSNQAEVFVECLARWDGSQSANNSRTGRVTWGTTRKKEADEVQAYLVRSGYEASMHVGKKEGKDYFYKLSIRRRGVVRFTEKKDEKPSGSTKGSEVTTRSVVNHKVMCVTVDSGFILIRQKGKCFITGNCSGEPSVTAHYSQDPRFTYANFTGVGKEPFYKDKILMLDDMYLMGASASPTGREAMLEAFNSTYGGNTFAEQWVENKKVITKDSNIAPIRKSHKPQILAMQYGQGAAGMVLGAADSGVSVSFDDCKQFHKAFWYDLFPGVRKLGERLRLQNKKQGYIVNEFGFRLFPSLFKSLNYFIQSSVSGIIDILMLNFYTLAPYCKHIAVIHDEIVLQCPDDRLDDARIAMNQALEALNNTLNWSVNIRTGWAEGKDFYEAH